MTVALPGEAISGASQLAVATRLKKPGRGSVGSTRTRVINRRRSVPRVRKTAPLTTNSPRTNPSRSRPAANQLSAIVAICVPTRGSSVVTLLHNAPLKPGCRCA